MSTARHGTTVSRSDRIARAMFLIIGLGGLVYLGLGLGTALQQSGALRFGASPVFFLALVVGCAGLAACAFTVPLPWLRGIGLAVVAVYTLTVLAWLPLQQSAGLPHLTAPWPTGIIAIATTYAFLVLPSRAAVVYLPAVCLVAGVVRMLADDRVGLLLTVEDTLFMLLICTLFAALLMVFIRAARNADALLATAYRDAEAHGASQARADQRARFVALVHDDVISSLLVAAQDDGSRRESVRLYARRALERVDAAARPTPEEEAVPPSECAARLRAASRVPGAPELRVAVQTIRPIPSAAVEALGEALGEALRNSLRHAARPDRAVFRSASAVIGDAGVRVEVRDDGAGFTPSRVPPERLGLRVSVIGRMSSVAGGSASIDSRPGEGTSVLLSWTRAAEPAGEGRG